MLEVFHKSLYYVKRYKYAFALIFILMFLSLFIQLGRPLIIRKIIDFGIVKRDYQYIVFMTLTYIFLLIFNSIISYVKSIYLVKTSCKVITEIKEDLFRHILKQEMNFFDQFQVGKLISRAEFDVEQMQALFGAWTFNILYLLLYLFGILFIIFLEIPFLAACCISFSLCLMVFVKYYTQYIRSLYKKAREQNSDITQYLTEFIQGNSIIKFYNVQNQIVFELSENIDIKNRFEQKAGYIDYILFQPSLRFISEVVSTLTIIWFSVDLVLINQITIGTVVLMLELIRQFFQPLQAISEIMSEIQNALAAASRVFEIFEYDSTCNRNRGTIDNSEFKFDKEIAFNDVSFAYKDELVLKNISLKIKKGQKVAFVGASGSGKTTCINLLMRFYEPKMGSITIDDVNIQDIDIKKYRSKIAFVPQETYLFPGTIMQNLKAFNDIITDEEVIKAAKIIGAHEVIMKLENGYYTYVTERGINLSAGEKQLIAYTRALIKRPELLLLDEATSSVDVITEKIIQKSLKILLEGRTAIIIAHRLSTIQDADLIYVFDRGMVVEYGSHQDLVEKKGYYYKLLQLQVNTCSENLAKNENDYSEFNNGDFSESIEI